MTDIGLNSRITQLQKQGRQIGVRVALAWAGAVCVIAMLVAMWIDLVVDLPSIARVACAGLAALGGLIIAVRVMQRMAREHQPRALAEKLDRAAHTPGEILSGVDLALQPPAHVDGISGGLTQVAVSRAGELMQQISPRAVLPVGDVRRPMYVLCGLGLAVLVLVATAPRLAKTQWARFIDPYGDHPPYSQFTFTVEPGNTRVIFGSSMDVRAKVDGGPAERVDLMLVSSAGQTEALPMFPEADGQWRASVTNVVSASKYFVRTGKARSHRFELGVITVPTIEDVKFKITWPAYTHRPPYEGPLPQGGLSGLAGTNVQVKVKSNRPLASGSLTFTSGSGTQPTTRPTQASLAPAAAGDNIVVGNYVIESPGEIQVDVTDVDGQKSVQKFKAPISIVKDERPFVRMIEPKSNSFATPEATIHVLASAEDDFGISQASFYRGLNDTRPRPMSIPVPKTEPTQFPAEMELKLSDYGLNPGEMVKIFARVEDNDPAGAKGSESQIVTIHIISQQDMDRMMIAREGLEAMEAKYAEASRRLEAMADKAEKLREELSKLDPKSELADAKRKELENLAEEMNKAADEIEKSAKHELPIDLDKALTPKLKELANALRDASKDVKEAGKPGMSASGAHDKMAEARKKLGKERDEFKKEVEEPLEHLAQILPLMEDQMRFLELAEQQKELADRMKALDPGAKDDPAAKARMRELQDQQEQVRRDLNRLLDDIDDHVTQLPEDPKLDEFRKQARDFSKAVRGSPADDQMTSAETSLSSFAATPAATSAQDAYATLDSFISKCNSMGQEGRACLKFQPQLANSMGNSLEQLLGSMGMGTGGMGSGRGGYSARRSSLQNVGLYGSRPVRGAQSSRSGNGRADRGVSTRADGAPDFNRNPDGTGSAGKTEGTGQGEAAVPQQYKKRVADYFRRVADELEE